MKFLPPPFRFISDFRFLNKCFDRSSYPSPTTADILQKLEEIHYAASLDLNMGFNTVHLDPDSQKLCTIITPWGKYAVEPVVILWS